MAYEAHFAQNAFTMYSWAGVYLVLQREDASAELIEAHLLDAATGRLGLRRTAGIEEASARAASKLMELRPQFQLH